MLTISARRAVSLTKSLIDLGKPDYAPNRSISANKASASSIAFSPPGYRLGETVGLVLKKINDFGDLERFPEQANRPGRQRAHRQRIGGKAGNHEHRAGWLVLEQGFGNFGAVQAGPADIDRRQILAVGQRAVQSRSEIGKDIHLVA
ncbi:MAG: hypothetical protein A2087_11565 [Spirochaetes bacterium GWD1_61_31]|nr:MAG: hypothetical protein A2Y37_14795 [Spirochaetes bacterium GWB1_60_80]OHD29331.1 MAG: hypothetical protein A2004_08295 [Spirochaetes bacterium GWC1_61_12]OHD35838.1 MAG: hypothetical protein A2087_11565 [Spirochaetes bacterium GWD1_61_31]OHD46780.1 MAG: hypothetical protein A2Y35_10735 [Spirochaetes bacterium GWE1_60_18]OHD61232.1 MAG: hypothetical protein A2Y32_13030 [Spirochaetes bacterium GWF1_60_12]